MVSYDVIIIGAGAAGLMAAKVLLENNKNICIVEARDRIGGRIHTLSEPGFSTPLEAGAEFIHGNLPLTIKLLKKAGIEYFKTEGSFWQFKNNELKKQEDFINQADILTKKLQALDKDISISEFLETSLPGEEYADMKCSFAKYVEGYDAADINDASTFGIREEWKNEEEEQYRINNGYGSLMEKMKGDCLEKKCSIFLSHVVKEIRWKNNHAEIITSNNISFKAEKVLITVPPVMLTPPGSAAISFKPALPHIAKAAGEIGYGGVIKIVIEFSHAFWETGEGRKAEDFFFIFSEEKIPTWWTQLPQTKAVLTGWLTGPNAKAQAATNDEDLILYGIESLASIFGIEKTKLRQWMKGSHVHNWVADPFCNGGYSYRSLTTETAKNVLRQPVSGTLFFAGEALSKDYYGTVEAALQSGMEVAEQILQA